MSTGNPNPPHVDLNSLTPSQLREYAGTGTYTPTPAPAGQPQPPAPAPAPAPAPQAQPPAPAPQPQPQPAAPQPQAAPTVPAPQRQADGTFVIQLPTGQVYKGATAEEAYGKVIEAQISASRTITELNTEAERLRRTVQAATGNAPQTDPNQPQQLVWDASVYRQLQEQDPMLAQNYMDACRFGLSDINQVQAVYRDTYATTNEVRAARTINEFARMAPDFPGGKENIDKVLGYMQRNNLPFTAENLNMVHSAMVKAGPAGGGYAPLVVANPQAQPGQPQYQPAPVPAPAPQPQPAPVINPQGMYAYGPNGFGSAPPLEVTPTTPVAQPQPQPQAAAPVPVPGFPAMPAQVQPLPAAPSGTAPAGAPQAQPGVLTEDAAALMDTQALRRAIEANMPR